MVTGGIMRVLTESGNNWYMARLMFGWVGEVAYIKFGLSGLQAEIEFPSDWHEEKMGWIRLGFGLFKLCFAFPWKWVAEDHGQCSGPTYGFNFFEDGLHLHWGNQNGRGSDPFKLIYMPWSWGSCVSHNVLTAEGEWVPYKPDYVKNAEDDGRDKSTHDYTYTLKSGEVQNRKATIYTEARRWNRWWIPNKLLRKSINVDFDGEVGERSGSWKGGTVGCGYEMLEGETPLDTLRRMEQERRF